jgi:hypothetical protein
VLTASLGAFLLGGALLWACGPFIHDWLLGSDEALLSAPTTIFHDEVQRLAPSPRPAAPAGSAEPTEEEAPFVTTAKVDQADLAAALDAEGVPADRRQALLDAHARLREALRAHAAAELEARMNQEMTEENGETPTDKAARTPHPLAGLKVPDGLPAEFSDYLRGALAYHQGSFNEARKAWQALLARPADQRRFRSTWAAFMLGKAALAEKDPEEALRWFERTREIAGQKGMRDSLGLASSSLGWQAQAELDLDRHAAAIRHYADQQRAGEPTAFNSLRFAIRQALRANPEALAAVAKDDRARPFVTAFVLARTEWAYESPEDRVAEARRWVEAVEKAGGKSTEGADQLAWLAYRAGDFEVAERWAKRAGDRSPSAKWLRARLLLRSGKLDEAEKLLAEVGHDLPAVSIDEDEAFALEFDVGDPVLTPLRALGEAGAVSVQRRDYGRALEQFLAGGYWRDAAYVAERVLTPEELRSYVDAHWPAEIAEGYDSEAYSTASPGLRAAPAAETAYKLRHLLARRLARLGRYDEARPYLPAVLQPRLDTLAGGIHNGRDAARPAPARSAALLEAACTARWYGLQLLGTEADPDWFDYSAQYDLGSTLEERERKVEIVNEEGDPAAPGKRFAATPDEIERARRNAAKPEKRFHYRYTAADLGWEAAALLPDGSPEKARTLAVAGAWIKDRDPDAASRFFKELVRCCGQTELGREAARRKWLPPVKGCGPEEGAEE